MNGGGVKRTEAADSIKTGAFGGSKRHESAVLETSLELNEMILAAQSYADFVSAKERLADFPAYKEMVDGFRRKQMEHQVRKLNDGAENDYSHSEELALANEYADICLINVCNDFFEAEMRLLELIRNVSENVFRGLEVF